MPQEGKDMTKIEGCFWGLPARMSKREREEMNFSVAVDSCVRFVDLD